MTPSADDQPESPHSTYDIVVTFVRYAKASPYDGKTSIINLMD